MSEDGELRFYTCDPRSVYRFESFHIPRRLKRIARQQPFEIRVDHAFELVVQNCRLGRPEWISDLMVELYVELHRRGHAHSVEAWQDGRLVGGLYGTQFGAAFMAESMFHTATHASNLCLVALMEKLQAGGFAFCDIQYANEHTAIFNPEQISQAEFMRWLKQASGRKAVLR